MNKSRSRSSQLILCSAALLACMTLRTAPAFCAAAEPGAELRNEAAARRFFDDGRQRTLHAPVAPRDAGGSLEALFDNQGAASTASQGAGAGLRRELPQRELLGRLRELDKHAQPSGALTLPEQPLDGGRAKGYGANWTILVYMAVDASDIDQATVPIIADMEQIGSSGLANVVALVDRSYGAGDYGAARVAWIQRWPQPAGQSLVHPDTSYAVGEVNTGDPNTLASFIQWGTQAFPSNYRALVIMGHGGGWRDVNAGAGGVSWLGSSKEVGYDETSGEDALTSLELRQALQAGGTRFDLIAFSSCMMGMTEVAYDLDGYCDVVVASEETMFGPLAMGLWLYAMNCYTDIDAWNAASFMLWAFQYRPINEQHDQTLAVALPGRMGEFVKALNAVVTCFCREIQTNGNALQAVHIARQYSGPEMGAEGGQPWPYIDIGMFLYITANYDAFTPETRAAAAYAQQVYDWAVPLFVRSIEPRRTGLSIFFPNWSQSNAPYLYDYTPENIRFAEVCLWAPFIRAYAGGGRSWEMPAGRDAAAPGRSAPKPVNIVFGLEDFETSRTYVLPEGIRQQTEQPPAAASTSLDALFDQPQQGGQNPSQDQGQDAPAASQSLEELFK